MSTQKNTLVTALEQVALLNDNCVKALAKLNDAVTSDNSVITITQTDSNGKTYSYNVPTISNFQSQITELSNNVKRLAGLNDNNVQIINGKSTKKIYLADLNKEPNKIDSIDNVSNFTQTNNWFFESLMNPTLAIKFDLSDKIGSDVDGVISRRYIVNFEKDSNGYTTIGESARQDFISKFVNKKNINIKDFLSWHTNSNNTGVVNNLTPIYDEQNFEFDYQEISDFGVFSINKQELDTINNKLWYHIYPYQYTTSEGKQKTLKSGDELILNKQDSVTRYKIIETSIASSNFRIRVERIEGFDPIPTGTNVMKFYGDPITNKKVDVTIGFDEYLVIFMKPLNSKTKIKGSLWSQGTGLYTNDLKLDTNSNVSLSQYYLDYVYDYGVIIKDMIEKTIPSTVGIIPNSPSLLSSNFKVVQINKHLTDTTDSTELASLQSQKNTIKTKLDQINNAIIQKNQDIATKTYTSVSEKDADSNELAKLIKDQETYTTNLYSITTQIKSKTDTISTVDPKYRVRGFWDMPSAQKQAGYRDQEVVQFRIQYRYSAKNGTENQTEGYSLTTTTSSSEIGYFSNWTQYLTDLRKRTYNSSTGEWTWEIEDVSDADTVNINQLDIPINSGEKVEIRIASISEVGYPDSILASDWSNIITIEFPDTLSSVADVNDTIITEATTDSIKVDVETTLNSKGLIKHVQDAFYYNDNYIGHNDNSIITNYKDTLGNTYTLREYLSFLTNKISKLEDIISSSKGVLKITIYDGKNETEISNGSETSLNVILQNYGVTKDGINYENKLSKISDFYIKIQNLSVSTALSFLVSETYNFNTNVRQNESSDLVSLVDMNNNLLIQGENQYIYFCDTYKNSDLYSGSIINTTGLTADINNSIINSITSNDKNIGLASGYTNATKTNNNPYPITGKIIETGNTSINEWFYTPVGQLPTLATTIAPQVSSISSLIPSDLKTYSITNEQPIKIPINIYWLFKTSPDVASVNLTSESFIEHTKSIRFRLYPTTLSGTFDCVINFNIQNKKM
jgi:hypothetical protein